MIIFHQANLRKSRPGLDLFLETARQGKASIALITEPNLARAKSVDCFLNETGNTAIKVLDQRIKVLDHWKHGTCFVRITTQNFALYSVYLSPSDRVDTFKLKLHEIQQDIERVCNDKIILGGDFNAKSYAWGSNIEDGRGKILGEWFAAMDLAIMNRGHVPTYVNDSIQSVIDITVCSQSLIGRAENWEVSMEENLSDHNTINFKLTEAMERPNVQPSPPLSWRFDASKEDDLKEKIEEAVARMTDNPEIGMKFLQDICEELFKKKRPRSDRKPAYWWNSEIDALRKSCLAARRKLVRENGRRTRTGDQVITLRNEYYAKKKELRNKICESRETEWRKLCEELNNDIWGAGYKIVCKKFKINSTINLPTEEKLSIAKKLFPVKKTIEFVREDVPEEEVPPFTMDELLQALTEIKNKKAPGPDGIVPEIIKVLIKTAPDYCLKIFNHCARKGIFPKEWKEAKLVLIEKEMKATDTTKSYRPICLLDGMGKVYEKLIKMRLDKEIEEDEGLSINQYGFISGKSTIDAMLEVQRIARGAKMRKRVCVMTMADVKNAFGSVPWDGIVAELRKRNISDYLINIMKDYFKDRNVKIDGSEFLLTCGVPQGSVLGAVLWNIYYDPILKIALPRNTTAIAYADDLALLTTGVDRNLLQLEVRLAMSTVNNWMKSRNLELAPQKTEIVLLASSRKIPQITVSISGVRITSKDSAKYLGVWFDKDMRMTDHIRKISTKAEKIAANLARLMPNINGPQNHKRKILASVVYSTLFYGVPAWVETAQTKKYRYRLEKVQRKIILRQCRAYRTSPTIALQVISGTLPIELMATEREKRYHWRKSEDFNQQMAELEEELIDRWQRQWNEESTKGQWTKTLIREIQPWVERSHGDVTFELSQFLTGHGNFAAYLKRFKIQEEDKCIYCQQLDTPKHTFFQCVRWQDVRSRCWESLGAEQSENTIISEMLKDKKRWDCVSSLITEIVKKKKMDTQRIEEAVARTRGSSSTNPQRLILRARRRLTQRTQT